MPDTLEQTCRLVYTGRIFFIVERFTGHTFVDYFSILLSVHRSDRVRPADLGIFAWKHRHASS
jgi:hypothetical protein